MDKVKQRLAAQHVQYRYLEQCQQQKQQRFVALYNQVTEWLSPYLTHAGLPYELQVSMTKHTVLILRFSCERSRSPASTVILLSIFDVDRPKERTQCWLHWSSRNNGWVIRRLKRKRRLFYSWVVYRKWDIRHLENWLVEFIMLPRT